MNIYTSAVGSRQSVNFHFLVKVALPSDESLEQGRNRSWLLSFLTLLVGCSEATGGGLFIHTYAVLIYSVM
jgi:hypothetical protein